MNDTIHYLNTDLNLVSAEDLSALVAALETRGFYSLYSARDEDGVWRATLELNLDANDAVHEEPEQTISAMLPALESLEDSLRTVWSGCTLREFDIGYDCGSKPWAFNQGLSNSLLRLIAAAGASLRITLCPPTPDEKSQ